MSLFSQFTYYLKWIIIFLRIIHSLTYINPKAAELNPICN
jgi:hypothetical protein